MIFVNRSCVPVPRVLSDINSLGNQERLQAIAFFGISSNREKSFLFKAYKHKSVVVALDKLFHGKCAYCESFIAASQPSDIDHFRPKSAYYILKKGIVRLQKPGYFWLAATWENLLPSCIDCNRERYHAKFSDESFIKSGKGNHFPLISEDLRATEPGYEGNESPLLLDPCADHPEDHLEFMEDGNIRARLMAIDQESEKGLVSINVYGLRRVGLVHAREAHTKRILAQIKRVKMVLNLLDQDSSDQMALATLYYELTELHAFMAEHQPYAGMARQIIETHMQDLCSL